MGQESIKSALSSPGASTSRSLQRTSGALLCWLRSQPGRYSSTLAIILLFATTLRYGIGVYPNLDRMLDLAVNWQSPISPRWREDFWVSSPVSAWIAGVLGLNEPRWFLCFHAALALVALSLPFALPRLRRQPRQAQLVLLVFAAGPVGAILFTWFGSYDAVSVLAIVIAILTRTELLRLLGWFLLAFNHNALGLAALLLSVPLIVATTSRANRTAGFRLVALATCGVLGGFMANTLLMRAWGAETSRLDFFHRVGFETFVHTALMQAPLIAFSAIGVGWLILMDRRIRSRVDTRIMLGLAVIATVVIPVITLDQSRVLGLALLAPMLIWAITAAEHYPAATLQGLWRTWRLPALLVPVVLVWYQGFIAVGWTWFLGLGPVLQAIAALPG